MKTFSIIIGIIIILSTYSLDTLFCQEGVKPDIKSIENRFIKQRQMYEERKKNDSLRNALPTEFKNKLYPHLKKDDFVNDGFAENGRKSPKKGIMQKTKALNNATSTASNELWVQKFNTKISAQDHLYDTFIDINNNIYITGESGGDIVTIKLNSSGDTIWSARYSGPAEYDEPCGIWVDGMGEVYVAGTSESDSLGIVQSDILLVKYNYYGNQQWVQRYKGPSRKNYLATILRSDNNSNIYIAGYSYSDYYNSNDSLITLKYNTNGNLLWAKKENFSGSYNITPTAMTLDLSGNIFITGRTNTYISPEFYSRIFTIKYSSGGNLLFNIIYGSGKYYFSSNDIAIDNLGNILITGSGSGSGFWDDFLTLKYNSSGTFQWARREPGNYSDYGKSIMVDNATNNLYITGSINNKINTIKYNSNGAKIWLKEFTQPNINQSYGLKILISSSTQFYVSGSCNTDDGSQNVLIKYDSSGAIIWSKLSNGNMKTSKIDISSNVIIAGKLNQSSGSGWDDYKLIKYNSDGSTLWEKNYDNFTYAEDYATSSTIDADNNVYVTGYSNSNNGREINTLKYSSNGSLLWIKKYNEQPTWDIISRKMRLDNLNNLYLSGTINSQMFIIKYNVNGDTVWTRKFENGSWSALVDMQIDKMNNIYLLGYTNGNILLTKYDLDGNLLWNREFNGTTNKSDYPYAMVIDRENNVIITGSTQDNSWYYDCVTIKYSTAGELLWERYYNGPANREDKAYDLAADDSLNIYIVGSSYSLDTGDDILSIKYSPSGEQLWISRYDNSADNEVGRKIVIDLSGDIIVTGNNRYEVITIKYDKAGIKKWKKIFQLPRDYPWSDSWYNAPIDLVADKFNNIFVYGVSRSYNNVSGEQNDDLMLVKYNEKGAGQWYTYYGSDANRDETGATICLDSSNNIIIVGSTDDYTTQKNYLTIKYENQITDMSGINGYVFHDKNINGIRDNLEKPFWEGPPYLKKDGNFYAGTEINEEGEYSFDFIPTGTYTLDIWRDDYFMISTPTEPYTIVTTNGQLYENYNFGVYFISDTIRFRTFPPDSLCVVKPIKKKNIATRWSFNLGNYSGSSVNGMQIQFNGKVSISSYTKFLNIRTNDNKTWILDGTDIPNGEFTTISGIGPKSGTKVKYQCLKNNSPVGYKYSLYPTSQRFLLPMPNAANVRDYVFSWGGFPEGLIVGIMDDPKEKGWVKLKKSKDLLNSLIDKSGKHTGKPRGFDKFENQKTFRGEQKKLPPQKHNNKLFAEIAALKFNIAASALEATPNGLGELMYWEETGNSYVNQVPVQYIADIADELMTYYSWYDSTNYKDLDTVISKINRAFEGPIDTLRFGTGLKIKGTLMLGEIPYLHGEFWGERRKIEPRIIAQQETPDEYLLYQNYPNPFNPSTTIQFNLPTSSVVTLKIYNVLGQEVAKLLDKVSLEDGEHQIEFNAYRLSSGVYFYRLTTESSAEDEEEFNSKSFVQVKKMILLK